MTAPTSPGVVPADVRKKPIKLKACPFCGGPARFFAHRSAGCADGHAISPEMETAKQAAAWWNMRRRPLRALADRSEPRQEKEGDRG